MIVLEEITTRLEVEGVDVVGITDRVFGSPIKTFRLITNRGRIFVVSSEVSVMTLRVVHFTGFSIGSFFSLEAIRRGIGSGIVELEVDEVSLEVTGVVSAKQINSFLKTNSATKRTLVQWKRRFRHLCC